MKEKKNTLKKLNKGLIVSCQALENEPLHSSYIMGKMALAAKEGGAVAIRANSVVDILEIKKNVDLPIIGLIKHIYPNSERFITPTMKEINELISANVEVIAMDATLREQIDGVSLEDKVKYIQSKGILAMADISTLEEALNAEKIGFDLISSTLSGYTPYSKQTCGPDFEIIEQMVKTLNTPVIAEGKISNEAELAEMVKLNPYGIVMGSAITRPQLITKRYVDIYKGNCND